MAKTLPSTNLLKKLLSYNPETGELRWRSSMGPRYAGKPAGACHNNGFMRVGVDGGIYRMQDIVYKMHYDVEPSGFEGITHINGVGTDNRIENLRLVDRKLNSNNKSGVTGVNFNEKRNRWRAIIGVKGTFKHLGYFKTFKEAQTVREMAELVYRN